MKKYSIITLNNSEFDYLVISNTYENPINSFLSQGIIPQISDGKILFDLTLIYGFKPNRYVMVKIADHVLDVSSIQPIVELESRIKEISKRHFEKNSFLVENSILPSALKYHILHDNSCGKS
ncbi:MAG: type II toxin-antitoxin system RnlB family antitoxin [Anaerovoracaceae bacterium]